MSNLACTLQKSVIILILLIYCDILVARSTSFNEERAADIDIKLVTIGPGDDLTSWWGHTAVIVEDKRLKSSLFYNYGLFSFDQENFVLNFAMGRLVFWVAAWNTRNALALYVSLNRDIRIQILDLTAEKKMKMVKFLANNVLPENRSYLYHHYRDNCSTRVRDLIDKILDGQFYSEMHSPSPYTFRQHTTRHTSKSFIMNWLLMFLMSDNIDKKILIWDDMFLPEELERNVEKISYLDENGVKHKLVSSSYTFYQARGREPLPQDIPLNWPTGLAVGLILASFSVLFGFMLKNGHKYSNQVFGLFHLFLGLLFGIPGLALFFISFFTDHTVTYHNENLFLSNPLTFLYIPLGIFLIFARAFSKKWLSRISYVLAGSGLILLILKAFPAFNQKNELSLALILPVSFGMALAWYIQRIKPSARKKRSDD